MTPQTVHALSSTQQEADLIDSGFTDQKIKYCPNSESDLSKQIANVTCNMKLKIFSSFCFLMPVDLS